MSYHDNYPSWLISRMSKTKSNNLSDHEKLRQVKTLIREYSASSDADAENTIQKIKEILNYENESIYYMR